MVTQKGTACVGLFDCMPTAGTRSVLAVSFSRGDK